MAQPLPGKMFFLLSNFYMIDNLSIAAHAFFSRILMSFSVDETLLPRDVKLSTEFSKPPFSVKMTPFRLKHVLCFVEFTWRSMPPASRQCRRDSAWVGVFARSAMLSA